VHIVVFPEAEGGLRADKHIGIREFWSGGAEYTLADEI
jgi:hypothetical protein